ncbi:MAG: NosD domain-containing protein [Candidatus Bathyarchaeia archaeon]
MTKREEGEIKGKASRIMLILLFLSMSTSASSLHMVKAISTIHIRADGSVDPVTAPIQRNGDVFTLTGNVASDTDGIVIERNNTILDGMGYTLQGTSAPLSNGVYLSGIGSVTIRGVKVKAFDYGIYLYNSPNNNISENEITDNEYGIYIDTYSSNIKISGNKIANNNYGISCVLYSDDNLILGNNITENSLVGVWIVGCSSNNISENRIVANEQNGIRLETSSDSSIYHNDFMGNANQVYTYDSTSVWDNGYPSGGNYWSDYAGSDNYFGPYQNQPGKDGIGDTPYNCSGNDQDRYPLMKAWTNIAIQTVSPCKTVVGQGQNVTITVSVQNQGWDGQTTNITVYVNATIVSTFENVIIVGGSQTTLNFTWQTGTFSRGNYVISAQADPAPGETDTTDNTFQNWIIVTIKGDINGDGTVDIYDAILLAGAFNSVRGSSNWNPNADINSDGTVDIYDAIILAGNFGKKS